MQGLQKTVHADTEFWSLPSTMPNAVLLYKLPAGVKIRPDAQGTERDGFAHVYDPTNRDGWIAIGDLTPFEESVRQPAPTPAPAPKPSTSAPPASNSSMIGSGIDWKTVGIAGAAVGGAVLVLGGIAVYLKKRRRR